MKQSPSHIESQIREKKNEIEHIGSHIETLNKQRAIQSTKETAGVARAARIEDIDKEIEDYERVLKNLPHEIDALKEQLTRVRRDEDYDKEILKTAPSLSEGQRLSKILLKQLEGAEKTSGKLIQMRVQRDAIRRQTDQPLAAPHTSSGFHSLKLLTEICQKEIDGQGRVSNRFKDLPEQYI